MDVTRYTFQSPYPSQIQVGKPDVTSKQQGGGAEQGSSILKNTNQVLQDAQAFDTAQKQEVTPSVNSSQNSLDLYV